MLVALTNSLLREPWRSLAKSTQASRIAQRVEVDGIGLVGGEQAQEDIEGGRRRLPWSAVDEAVEQRGRQGEGACGVRNAAPEIGDRLARALPSGYLCRAPNYAERA